MATTGKKKAAPEIDEREAAINKDNDERQSIIDRAIEEGKKEQEIEIRLPNGDTKKLFFDLTKMNVLQMDKCYHALVTFEQFLEDPPKTMPELQKVLKDESNKVGLALLFYIKDSNGNQIPYDADLNIQKHEPYNLVKYIYGDQYDKVKDIKATFLGKWGKVSRDYRVNFLDTAKLLMQFQSSEVKKVLAEQIEKKNLDPKLQKQVESIMNSALKNAYESTSQTE